MKISQKQGNLYILRWAVLRREDGETIRIRIEDVQLSSSTEQEAITEAKDRTTSENNNSGSDKKHILLKVFRLEPVYVAEESEKIYADYFRQFSKTKDD